MERPMTQAMAPRNQHWAQINEFSFVAGMRVLYWLCRLVGRGPVRLILYPVLFWYFISKPAARTASRDYLRRVATHGAVLNDDLGKLTVFRHFEAFAECILDKMLLWSGLFEADSVKYQGQALIAAQIGKNRGALLICCHLGNLDLCRVLSKQMPGLKMTALIHTKHAQRFNQLLAELNPESQLNLMQVTEVSANTAVLLEEKIVQGEFVAIAGDRIPVTPKPRVALANFLGATAPFPVGPYVLADLLQCPVYLLFTLRRGRSSEIHFELFREAIRLPRKQRDRELDELVAQYAGRLEHFCRRAPLQWFNFYQFWHLPAMNDGAAKDANSDVTMKPTKSTKF
jgi:predicted LPLAT superfamily acyltransferase